MAAPLESAIHTKISVSNTVIPRKMRLETWINNIEEDYENKKISKEEYVKTKSKLLSQMGAIGKIKSAFFQLSHLPIALH